MAGKFKDVRRWSQCARCHKFRELRAVLVQEAAEVQFRCDACFDVNMDDEAFDMAFEKAGVSGPHRFWWALRAN